ncbi:lipopolysaccharide heptosyltransferase 1 [Rodentibacter pneumotropicus]|uniref:Lipopolysaccharide heptosyltransferase 1 n=1 Tax=Rodentibacter pneumotropicus TaxID=758 RepID=A0A448MIF0_9PAST|nr:lipopolysaccharide heptosyltransferase 1 [Rodentibacter pneumotropicus]
MENLPHFTPKERYDAVIDAQGLFKSAFFTTRLVNGTKHGYDCHSIREPIATFFYDKNMLFLTTNTPLNAFGSCFR